MRTFIIFCFAGLQSRIESWTQTKDLTKKYKIIPKLYVLVPKSCYCPPSLTTADPQLRVAGVTPSFVANRAGNQRREYKNTVYCFEADGTVSQNLSMIVTYLNKNNILGGGGGYILMDTFSTYMYIWQERKSKESSEVWDFPRQEKYSCGSLIISFFRITIV